MGWLPPRQCRACGTRSQKSGSLLGQPLSGQSPFRARQGTCCGYAGLGEDSLDRGASWLEKRKCLLLHATGRLKDEAGFSHPSAWGIW